METTSNDNSGRENFDTENTQNPASDVTQNMDDRYDKNPKTNNFETDEIPFGLDDSPLDIAEWKKNDIEQSLETDKGRQHRKAPLDNENDSTNREERNISFDRDL